MLIHCSSKTLGDVIHWLCAGVLIAIVIAQFISQLNWARRWPAIASIAERRGQILIVLLATGLVSGLLGNFFESMARTRNEDLPASSAYLTDRVYLSWTQFFADGEVARSDSLGTRIGRMCGLAFLTLVAYEAFQRLLSPAILDLNMATSKNHAVICGTGRIGTVLARDLLNEGKKVIVIEKNASSPSLAELRSRGANVLVADATLHFNLKRTRCQYADEIFIVTGSDEANLDIAADVLDICRDSNEQIDTIPSLMVHLHQMRLERILAELTLPGAPSDQSNPWQEKICAFNPLDESIRKLFDQYVILRRPRNLDQVAHYIIIGFGNTGQSLALFLAENAHFANLKRARMTIVYRAEEHQAVERFKALYPKFFPSGHSTNIDPWTPDPKKDLWSYGIQVVHELGETDAQGNPLVDWDNSVGIEFVVNGGFALMEGGVTSPEFLQNLTKLCKEPAIRPIVFLCNNNDEENCAEAIELRQVMDERLKFKRSDDAPYPEYIHSDYEVSIFAYVPDHPSLSRLLNKRHPMDRPDRIAWGDCQSSCTHKQLKSQLIKQLSEAIQFAYAPLATPQGRLSLSWWQIESNRKAATHLNAKLSTRSLRVYSPPVDAHILNRRNLASLFESDLLVISQMEHYRYIAERLLQDWAFGPRSSNPRIENRCRSSFLDWNRLNDVEKQTAIEQIRATLEYLARYPETMQDDGLSINKRDGEHDEGSVAAQTQISPEIS